MSPNGKFQFLSRRRSLITIAMIAGGSALTAVAVTLIVIHFRRGREKEEGETATTTMTTAVPSAELNPFPKGEPLFKYDGEYQGAGDQSSSLEQEWYQYPPDDKVDGPSALDQPPPPATVLPPPPSGRDSDLKKLLAFFDQLWRDIGGTPSPKIEGSPTNLASEWLIGYDPARLDPANHPEDFIMERYVMAIVYYTMGGGESLVGGWIDRTNYLTGLHVCDWYGVRCSEDSGDAGAMEGRRITRLLLGEYSRFSEGRRGRERLTFTSMKNSALLLWPDPPAR